MSLKNSLSRRQFLQASLLAVGSLALVAGRRSRAQTMSSVYLPLVLRGGGGSSPRTDYDPPWAERIPTTCLVHAYNTSLSAEENGDALLDALNALRPGQCLNIQAGTYAKTGYFKFDGAGTAGAPIWIIGEPGVIITHVDDRQNIMNFGVDNPVRYMCLRGIEFTGGSHGLRFYDCQNVWLDQCHIHDTGDAGISTNTVNTSFMYITRNEINNTGGTGEGMYLGANNGAVIMSQSIIALNHVHHTNAPSVTQGDGIELKQGSWGNLIAENHIHDCNYPCILVYGTAGQPVNVVERNICYHSNDNTLQIQGECVVRNNLILNGANAAFASTDHQGNTVNLQVVHNTIVNTARAMNLSSWNGRSGMVLANNVAYSQTGNSLRFPNGSMGVVLAGNVVAGDVSGITDGYVFTSNATNPLADFEQLTWDAVHRNARPVAGCTIVGAGVPAYAVANDLTGAVRVGSLESGCYDLT